jgi:hypothetical protein
MSKKKLKNLKVALCSRWIRNRSNRPSNSSQKHSKKSAVQTNPHAANKFIVQVNYLNTTRPSLYWEFEYDNMKNAITIAQMYSEDSEVMTTYVLLNQLLVAQFAGYWQGRVYDTS